jgi:predicted RND superfamily exporter protein
MKPASPLEDQPVVRRPEDFDAHSGSAIERAFFNHRGTVLVACAIVTILLGYGLTKLRLNASFEKSIPTTHPYVENYLKHRSDLGALGNVVRVTVEATQSTIYTREYLEALQRSTTSCS